MPPIKNKKIFAGLLAILAMTATTHAAVAAESGSSGLKYGVGDKYSRTTLVYKTKTLLGSSFGNNGSRLELTAETGVSYWKANGSRIPGSVWQLHATPLVRWWLNERFFFEGGVGLTAFNKTKFAGKTISTAFQFGDQIGVGALLNKNSCLNLRYAHFSNASIKRPNPGLNVVEIGYTYQF